MTQIAVAPILTMPEPLQKYFLYITILATGLFVLYAMVAGRKWGSPLPLLLVITGFCSIPLESIVTFLGHAVHPQIGNIAVFSAVDRSVPWHIALGYTVAFGLMNIVIWRKTETGSITPKFIFTACVISVLGYQVFEIAGVSTGLWVYYQPQPVWLIHATAPLTWSFLNTASMIFESALIVYLLPHLRGVKVVLVPVLGPVAAYMAHMGAGWPMYNVVNSDASAAMMQLSGVAAILLSVFMWWLSSLLIMDRRKLRNLD